MTTKPRVSPPNTTHMVVQRCILRMLLLLPNDAVKQSLFYILGYLQARHKLEYHNVCCLRTHLHLMLTDILGDRLQRFNREFFCQVPHPANH